MGGSVKDQRPVSIKLHAKYPIDYPDRWVHVHVHVNVGGRRRGKERETDVHVVPTCKCMSYC